MPRPLTALIVDDEPHVHVYLRILLKQLGVETVWDAAEGYAAIELAAAHNPDVVLLDVNLPHLNGMEVLAKLKAANPRMYVIVVSVESKPETLVQANELGADGYVLKHLPRAKVLEKLSEVFDRFVEVSSSGAAGDGEKSAPAS
jgi:DNA-binding NarL/FixJ family response regulator